ncbi:hypothetical protein [Cellulomonas citrea]|uniref:hypothetical protein n=1 Tax=Cellulomonas citrea TaxID=1909423 RepID=UPI001358F8EA|nr:hypothetical protein [Cellulomonas citrea]
MHTGFRRFGRLAAVVALATAAVTGLASTALADYSLNGSVTARSYLGSTGTSGVYKSYSYSVNGSAKVCVRSSSNSQNNPTDAANFSKIFIVSGGTQSWGGYGNIAVGDTVKMYVNTDAPSPLGCNGYKLAYMVWVYK